MASPKMASPKHDYLSKELPVEVLHLIESNGELGEKTVASLAATCKKLYAVFSERLYQKGIRTEEQTQWRRDHPVMIWAAYHNRVDIMRALVAYGADVRVTGYLQQQYKEGANKQQQRPDNGYVPRPEQHAQPIHFAAMGASHEAIEFLIGCGISIDEPCDARLHYCWGLLRGIPRRQETPYQQDIARGRAIYSYSPWDLTSWYRDTIGATPLLFAISLEKISTAEFLLEKGAFQDPVEWSKENQEERYRFSPETMIGFTVAAGQHSLLPLVWQRAHELHPQQPFGGLHSVDRYAHKRLLELALVALRSNPDTLRQLARLGVSPDCMERGSGGSALAVVARGGRWRMASELLELGAAFDAGSPSPTPGGNRDPRRVRSVIVAALLSYFTRTEVSRQPEAERLREWKTGQEQLIRHPVTQRGLNSNHYFHDVSYGDATPLYHCMRHLRRRKPALRRLAVVLFELGADPGVQRYHAEPNGDDDTLWKAAHDPSFWWDEDELESKGITRAYSSSGLSLTSNIRANSESSTLPDLLAFIKTRNELDAGERQAQSQAAAVTAGPTPISPLRPRSIRD